MSLPSIQRVRLLLALHLLLSSTQKEERGGRGEGRGRLSKPRGSKGGGGGWQGGRVEKNCGGELGEGRNSRRGVVVGGGGEVAVGFLGGQSNRLVVGSNVPSKTVDAL